MAKQQKKAVQKTRSSSKKARSKKTGSGGKKGVTVHLLRLDQMPQARGNQTQISQANHQLEPADQCCDSRGPKTYIKVEVPTVNRMVHYQAHGSPNGQHKSVPRCAIVTAVPPGQPPGQLLVSLCILNPTGQYFNERVPYSLDAKPGHWSWPVRELAVTREVEVQP